MRNRFQNSLSNGSTLYRYTVLQNMTSLTTLDLSRNQLAGAPPAWLGQLQKLKVLRLSQNSLRGPLTDWLNADNKLTELTALALDGNAGITGPLTAAAIRPLAKLRTLNLNDVGSFGTFPEALGTPEASLGALTEFSAANAGLTGQLPPRFFEALKSLERLDLRRNSLTGSIPCDADTASGGRRMLLNVSSSSLPVLTHSRLSTLFLSDNQLHGLVPALPSQLVSQLKDGVNSAIDLKNAAGSHGFDCPLPSTHAVRLYTLNPLDA